MSKHLKSYRLVTAKAWRFLYKANAALTAVNGYDAICTTAVELAVPRLGVGCTISGEGNEVPLPLWGRKWQSGDTERGESLSIPLKVDGRPFGVMTFFRAGGWWRRARAAARLYAQLVGRVLARLIRAEEAADHGTFTAMLAHELRNALVPLQYGMATIRTCGPESAPGRAACDRVEQQVGRLRTVLDGMIDLYRAERGKFVLRISRMDLAEIAQRAAEAVLIRERGFGLSLDVAPDARMIWADPVRLEQILINLFANAAKYSRRGGEISLGAERDGESVLIRVRDHGAGIPPELLARLFEPFTQADPELGGLGLGLALVRRLVELHGGTVWAESNGAGQGSLFTVWLPTKSESPSLASAPVLTTRVQAV